MYYRRLRVLFLIVVAMFFFTGYVFGRTPSAIPKYAGPKLPKYLSLKTEGKIFEAKELLEEKIKMEGAIPLNEHQVLCSCYSELKEYSKLFECADEVQARYRKGEYDIRFESGWTEWGHLINPSIWKATAYLELSRYEEAIKELENTLKLVNERNMHPAIRIGILGQIGLAYAYSGEDGKAGEVINTLENQPPCPAYGYEFCKSESKGSLAILYFHYGDYGKTIECARVAQKELDDFANDNAIFFRHNDMLIHGRVANIQLILKSKLMLGKTDEAREGYDKLLQREERIKNFGELYWAILSDRGLIYIKDKKPAEAINFFKKAVAVIETQRSTINTEASKIGFVGDKQEVYKNLIAALFQEGKFAEALDYAERGKARALVDMLATKKNFYGASRDNKEVATLLRELEEAEQKSLALAYTSEKKNSLRAYVVNKRQEVIQAAPELFSLIAVSSLGSKDIQAMLPQDETLIEYYYHGDDLFAFAVTKDTVKGVKIDGKGLDKEVETFRKHIINSLKSNRTARQARGLTVVHSSTVANLNSTTDALYRRVFAPVEGLIKTKNVILVPHGSLHYLPFNALKSDKDYLINRYSLSVLPSASVMKFLQVQKKGQAGELIVFGNPDLGNAKYDLPFAQSEAMAITKDNPNAKVLLRKQASKTAVKKFAVQFKYVHFACHGTFNPAKPLESGLMLAKDESDDGMLTVSEMYNMRLNADLVTLSACETALGKVANGDDVVGFTRGFLFAGTNSIVSSLWQVDDKATSMIMEEFYRNLKTMDKRTALRLAQLKIINTYNEHPFFWAAFQLTGNVK